jgi:hypothetical protein
MKYLSLLGALAIIYVVAGQMGSTSKSVKSSIAEAEEEAAKVNPLSTPAPAVGATPAATSLRTPILRAQELQNLVKQRNADSEF